MYKPGESGNPGRRKKGSLNKSSEELRSIFRDFLSGNIDTVQRDFDCLKPRERLSFIERVAKLVVPPPQSEVLRLNEEDFQRLIKTIKDENVGQCEI